MIEIKLECPGQAPRVHRFAATTITVGRGTDCELCLEDPSLSRRHCRISCGLQGSYVVEDLGSANGTAVAGRRIVGSCSVEPGEAIALGELRLEIVARRGARGVVSAGTVVRAAPVVPAATGVVAAPGVVAGTVVRAGRGRVRAEVRVDERGGAGDMSHGTGRGRAIARVGVALVAVTVAVLGGWASAWAWDRPLVMPAVAAVSCRADDPTLLEADAIADAAALEPDVESALREGLRALERVRGTACAGQSRAAAGLRSALARSESQRLGQHPAGLRSLLAGADGQVLGLDADGGVFVWERERPGRRLEVDGVQAVARGPEGRVAVAGADGGVRVGGLDGPLREVMGGESVLALSFVGDDRLVVAEAGGRISVWRAGADGVWAIAEEWRAWAGVTSLQVAGDRVLGFGAGRAAVWQIGRGPGLALRTGAVITAAALDASGSQVVVGDAAGLVTRWSPGRRARGQQQRQRGETLTAHAGAVQAVAWVGDAVASVGEDEVLRVSELARRVRRGGPPLVLVAETPVPVDRLAVAGGGRWLIGVGRDGSPVRWDLEQRSRRLPASLRAGHTGAITALATVDGWAVSGGADGVVRAWELSDGTGETEVADETEAGLRRRACRALGWSQPGCA